MTEMPSEEIENDLQATLAVVVNDEEQYSVWPEDKPLPAGWRSAGFSGSESDCADYIDRVWTDMRPLSLRRQMDADK